MRPAADAAALPTDVQPPAATAVAHAAISDEGWSELRSLEPGLKRKHMRWTHVRTLNPEHRQPEAFTPQQLWDHIVQVYKNVYPEPANASGSIVLFGCVASERHKAAEDEILRALHRHVPTYNAMLNDMRLGY